MKRLGLPSPSLTSILLIGIVVTGIALIESWEGWPYAPFPIVHGLLALLVPLPFDTFRLRNPFSELRAHLRPLLFVAFLAVVFMCCFFLAYSTFLKSFAKVGDPSWDLIAEYRLLGKLYVDRYGWTTTLGVGYLFVGVWPMFGEEFFYRGFLFNGLKRYVSPAFAFLISGALFGLRHSFQLVYLWPVYPLVSGVAYFIWALGFALLWTWAYHRSQSLWLCIATHAANLVLAPLVFGILSP